MSGGGGGGGAGLMSCVREGSIEPPAPYRPTHTDTHNHGEGRTGRFFRGLRRMFKRRGSGARADASPDPKSSSTSELLDADRHARRKEGAYGSGLSVSHDSVFTGERSGDESSDERAPPGHHSHLATSHRAELVAAVRRRGRGEGSDDEDQGLPQSPPASPPTDKAYKRHHAGISHSSCSDGSLLSVGSSEMDEDSSSGHHNSYENTRSDQFDLYSNSEPPSGVAPLSHSAAKHKMAVRPRRTHGGPRRKKNNQIAASALPITPELNEEVIRSTTPDVIHKTSEVVTESFSSSTTTKHHKIVREQEHQVNKELQRTPETPSDTKLKSSSLPPGLALGHLIGQSPAKLSIAESNTPRSSIKRSQSSSQGQTLRGTTSRHEETIRTYRSEEKRVSKQRTEKKAEESCQEKKSKSEKRTENEAIRSSKKEESFLSRLLLRKSGKKSKKDQTDGDSQQDVKKTKTDKAAAQYKPVDTEINYHERQEYKPMPAERAQKSAGQKAFANQMHKRLDNKGAYVQDNAYKDVYSAAKVAGVEYNITDLKIAEETDKMLNLEMKSRFSRRDDFFEKMERNRMTLTKETIGDKRDSFNLNIDKVKRPVSVQRLGDPFATRAFITNELLNRTREDSPAIPQSEDEPPIRAMRIRSIQNDFNLFNSGSMPKNIPYFTPSMMASSSPPKAARHQSSDNIKHRSSEHVSDFTEKLIECKRESARHVCKTEESYVTSAMRSLGDEYIGTRSSIGKSHSFRYASETTSTSSQENQMPSLPAIVGISEPILESWEVNYRRNLTDRNDFSKRISARNYNIMHDCADNNYDSLPSTDGSYVDSLKTDDNDDRKPFTNSIHITMDNKRDSDISQIEAKIDDIISSPKPIISPILKSNSLDSINSSPEKPIEDRRKTISVESALSSKSNIPKELKPDSDNFVSVTHINKEQSPARTEESSKNKSDEKIPKTCCKQGVPEFLNIQLNKVDTKPITNVVLTANLTPKKLDSPQAEKELDMECFQITETITMPIRKGSFKISNVVENTIENTQSEEKYSPLNSRKSMLPMAPQSPSPPRTFFKKKAASVELQERPEKLRANSLGTDETNEKIYDDISMDQKSHSSFGSKSSIQSTDSIDIKIPDRHEETVIYRKKTGILSRELRGDRKNDDEPELMKVFARRSLKLKDSEVDIITQDIAACKEDNEIQSRTSKILKNEFNASIKSRDSDKENEDTIKEEEKRLVDIAARVSQFGAPHYQRSVSINSVANPKRESAPVYRNSEVSKYKKEVSDSTPEKRLRNRTFPDLSNDRDDIKNITKSEALGYKVDTLSKRPWQNDEKFRLSSEKEKRDSAVIENDGNLEKNESEKEMGDSRDADASPQFKGILQMRAEWERRAKQGMTK